MPKRRDDVLRNNTLKQFVKLLYLLCRRVVGRAKAVNCLGRRLLEGQLDEGAQVGSDDVCKAREAFLQKIALFEGE